MVSSFRISWRNLMRNKKRFLFALSAVILGIVVMTGMLITKETTAKTFDELEQQYAGDADFFVKSTDGIFSKQELEALNADDHIEQDVYTLFKHGTVDMDHLNAEQSSVRISGMSSFNNDFMKLSLIEGDLQEDGLVITENAQKLWDKQLGDLVQFANMGELPITAIVQEGSMLSSPENAEQANFQHVRVIVPLHILQDWLAVNDDITEYRFQVVDGVEHESFLKQTQDNLQHTNLFIQPIVIDYKQNNDVEGLYLVFNMIAIISVFISGFIAFNMIYASVIERQKEFAIMKSLGYTSGSIYRLILQEIGLLAVIGTLIALPIGIWFGSVFQSLLISAVATGEVTYTLKLMWPLLISGAVGLLFPFVAASFPVYYAGKISVMEAIVDRTPSVKRKKYLTIVRMILGVIFTAIGMIDHPILFLFLFVGLVLLYPTFMKGIQKVLKPIFKVLLKYPGEQAGRSIGQFMNRNANTSAMLAIGVSVAMFMSALLVSLPDGIEAEVHQLFGGDMHIEKETPWEEHDIENIQSLEGVIDAKTFIEAPNITWKTVDGLDREFSMMSFSGEANEADMFRMIEKSSHTSSLPNIYLGERAFNEWGGEIGETITLNTPKGSQEFFVQANIASTHYTGYVAFVSEDDLEMILQLSPMQVAITTEDESSQMHVMEYVRNTYGSSIVSITTASMIAEKSSRALIGMEDLMLALLLLIIVLTAIGISNTLFVNTLERTREIGMMRAIGFTKGQVRLMIISEGLIIGLTGVIIGISYGILIIFLNALSEKELLEFTIPTDSLVLAIVGGLLFSLLATWIPAIIASRVTVKEAIVHE